MLKNSLNIKLKEKEEKEIILTESLEQVNIELEKDSKVTYKHVLFKPCNIDITINLVGENASFEGDFLVLGSNGNYNINQNVTHKDLKTKSSINNFCISTNDSHILINTTGHVLNKMKKSKCVQLTKGVVLSNDSSIKSLPILKIDEFDVIANHGCAIGKINENQLFYLMSRGLSMKEASFLIISGMIEPFLDKIKDENVISCIKKYSEEL